MHWLLLAETHPVVNNFFCPPSGHHCSLNWNNMVVTWRTLLEKSCKLMGSLWVRLEYKLVDANSRSELTWYQECGYHLNWTNNMYLHCTWTWANGTSLVATSWKQIVYVNKNRLCAYFHLVFWLLLVVNLYPGHMAFKRGWYQCIYLSVTLLQISDWVYFMCRLFRSWYGQLVSWSSLWTREGSCWKHPAHFCWRCKAYQQAFVAQFKVQCYCPHG